MAKDDSGNGWALVGIGGAHVDRIGSVSGAYHPGASNPGHLMTSVGGGALNALRNIRLRGVDRIALVSARGGDHDGAIVADTIEQAGIVDLSAVFLDRRTASYTAILDCEGEQIAGLADMDIYETALPRQLRRRALRDAISAAGAVLVDANLPAAAIGQVCTLATGPVFAIAISPAKAVRLGPQVRRFEAVFMNRRELAALAEAAGEPADPAAIGFRRAVVTDGGRPVLVVDGHERRTVTPPEAGPLRDVTGAGDALAGATIAALVSNPGIALAEAVRDGVAAASLTITTSGPIARQLTGPEFAAIRDRTTVEQTPA